MNISIRMFDDHYEFSIGDDFYHWVKDIAPVTQNREHKHEDAERGLDNYTHNWDCIASSTQRRRGSDNLYLVDDTHYVCCSRTGMESSGNLLKFSLSSPEDLRLAVCRSVTEGVLRRKFGEISNGIDASEFGADDGGLTTMTPRAFILGSELSQSELDEYHDELADLVVEFVDRFHETQTIEELKEITEWYDEQTTILYREYVYDDFTPTLMSQVIPDYEPVNDSWILPPDLDDNKKHTVFIWEPGMTSDEPKYIIEIVDDSELTYTKECESSAEPSDKVIETESYEGKDDLVEILDVWTKSPGSFLNKM